VTGGPGAGKSALLDYVMNSAGDAETIRIEGWSRRQRSGWPGCTGCCCSIRGRSALPPAQRRAPDASLGLSGPAEAAPFLLGLAVLTVLNDLPGSRLLVCLIDDAHWLDPESAQVLAFVARRLQNERILMVFAAPPRRVTLILRLLATDPLSRPARRKGPPSYNADLARQPCPAARGVTAEGARRRDRARPGLRCWLVWHVIGTARTASGPCGLGLHAQPDGRLGDGRLDLHWIGRCRASSRCSAR
jgi:hypothetical protein